MAKHRSSRYRTQASQLALVKFGPQITALQQLAQDAAGTYKQTTAAARAAAAGTQSAVQAALPQTAAIYDQSGLAAALANQHLGGDLMRIQGGGAPLDAIRAGAAQEMANLTANLATAKASALTDLRSRGTRAAEGAQFATENARQTLVDQLTKIAQQQLALGGQQGAFEASTISDLTDKQAQRDFTAGQNALNRHNSRLTAGVDASGHVIPGGKADKPGSSSKTLPGGAKLQTTSAHSSLMDKLDAVRQIANPLAAHAIKTGHHRDFVARLLIGGYQGGTLHDPATGRVVINKQSGLPEQAPTIKPQNQLLSSIALDLAFDGHVSHRNAMELHRRGYSLKALGLPGPPRQTPAVRQQGKATQNASLAVNAALQGLLKSVGVKG